MARAGLFSALAFLLLLQQPLSVSADFLSPLLSPIFDDVCKEVECGKGTCKTSNNSTFLFECECDPGWKQPLSYHDHGLKFLPCIVPNCTLNYSCSKAPAPAQQNERKANMSDACSWIDCGGGSCNKTSLFSYSCQCDAGYYNLLNATALPCFKECSLGMGCSNLGISMTNSSTAAPPALDESAGSIIQGRSLWLLMLMILMVNIQLKYHILWMALGFI